MNTKNENLAQEICSVFYEFIRNVESIAQGSVTGAVSTSRTVTFKSGGAWNEIKFTPGSAKLSETPSRESAGSVYDQQLVFSVPGEDSASLQDMDDIIDQPILVRIVYTSSQVKLLGSLDNPAKLRDKLNIGGTSGRDITISRSGDRAYWLNT